MNVGEATCTNMLLKYLFGGDVHVTSIGARAAAAELADRAHRAVHAGYTGEQVTAMWPTSVIEQAARRGDAQRQLNQLVAAVRGAADGWARAADLHRIPNPETSAEIEMDAAGGAYNEVAGVLRDLLAQHEIRVAGRG